MHHKMAKKSSMSVPIVGSVDSIYSRRYASDFSEKGQKRAKKGKIFENLGKKCTKFENILKKGRLLCAIIAGNKLLEKIQADKRSITDRFIVTLGGQFFPMQLIYGGKTVQSLLRFTFPDFFCLSANSSHYSNMQESIKVITEMLVPYVEKQCQQLKTPDQAALLIMKVFRGQIADNVISLQQQQNILLVLVPNNMTHIFQPLDMTVNKHCKTFLKKLFSEQYSKQIESKQSLGKKLRKSTFSFVLQLLNLCTQNGWWNSTTKSLQKQAPK